MAEELSPMSVKEASIAMLAGAMTLTEYIARVQRLQAVLNKYGIDFVPQSAEAVQISDPSRPVQ